MWQMALVGGKYNLASPVTVIGSSSTNIRAKRVSKVTEWMEQRYVSVMSRKKGKIRSVASLLICLVTAFDFTSHELLDALWGWQT